MAEAKGNPPMSHHDSLVVVSRWRMAEAKGNPPTSHDGGERMVAREPTNESL